MPRQPRQTASSWSTASSLTRLSGEKPGKRSAQNALRGPAGAWRDAVHQHGSSGLYPVRLEIRPSSVEKTSRLGALPSWKTVLRHRRRKCSCPRKWREREENCCAMPGELLPCLPLGGLRSAHTSRRWEETSFGTGWTPQRDRPVEGHGCERPSSRIKRIVVLAPL